MPLQDKMAEFLLILIIEKLEELMVFKNLLHITIILICFSDVKSVHNVAMIVACNQLCHNALRTLFEIECDHCNLKNEVLQRL